jgi:predicted solute-binding protein
MNSFHGEPIIQELVERVGIVLREIEVFRDVFEYTLDEELEEELNEIEKSEENTPQAV